MDASCRMERKQFISQFALRFQSLRVSSNPCDNYSEWVKASFANTSEHSRLAPNRLNSINTTSSLSWSSLAFPVLLASKIHLVSSFHLHPFAIRVPPAAHFRLRYRLYPLFAAGSRFIRKKIFNFARPNSIIYQFPFHFSLFTKRNISYP